MDEWTSEDQGDNWTFHNIKINQIHLLTEATIKSGAIFIDDAQLKKKESFPLLLKIMKRRGCVLLTGFIEAESPAALLQSDEQVKEILYPVHLNIFSSHLLNSQNDFDQVILFHCENQIKDMEKNQWFSEPIPGSLIQF